MKDMRSIIQNRPLSYRYLFYTYMGILNNENHPTLSIEWICNREKKEIDVSPYVKLIASDDCRINDISGKPENWSDAFDKMDSSQENIDSKPQTIEPIYPS